MDTRLLRSYLAVARLGSFTDAAAELGFRQSTVTSHVQKLEQQLGCRLLDRLPAGTTPTETGARLEAHAEEVLAAEARLHASSRMQSERPSGTVRLVAPESLCTYRLPAVVSAVRAAEPDVQLWLSPDGITDSLVAVRRGTADIALTMERVDPAPDLEVERIGAEAMLLVDDGTHGHEAVTWADLAARDALLIAEGCGYADDVVDRLESAGGVPGRRARFGSVEAIKRCAAVGLGWAALPTVAAEPDVRSAALAVVDGPRLPDYDVAVVTHPRRHHGPAVQVVLAELRRAWGGCTDTD